MNLDLEIRLASWQEIRTGLENGSVDVNQGMYVPPKSGTAPSIFHRRFWSSPMPPSPEKATRSSCPKRT